MNIVHNLILDNYYDQSQHLIRIRNRDYSHTIHITFSSDSDIYKFHTEQYGIAAQFVFRLSDGTISDREATIADNRITIDVPRQATSQSGIVECECKIYAVDENEEIRVLTSARFNLYISDVILDEDTQNRITDDPTMYEKAIAKGIAEGTISTADAKRKNSQIYTAQIVDVARSYYRKRGSAETGYNFIYGQDATCLDNGFDPATGVDIDCSTFIGLCLRGIPIEKSPYESLYDKPDVPEGTDGGDGGTSASESGEGEDYSPRTVLANTKDFAWAMNPAEYKYPSETTEKKVVRTAAQIGQMMVEQGLKIDYDDTFIDVEPGDIIFYAKKKDGVWVKPKRYMKISHVSICVNKIYTENFDSTKAYTVGNYCYLYADADKGITEGLYRCITDHTGEFNPDHFSFIGLHRYRHTTIEASTGDPVLYNRTLERNKEYICLICRPDLGAVSNAEWTGNLVTDLGITNIDNIHRDGLYYLTSDVTGGLPVWIRNTVEGQTGKGTGYALRVESTYRKNGNVYSIIQTLIDTRHDNEMSVRTKYLYRDTGYIRPEDESASWTAWSVLINDHILQNIMTANGLGNLAFDPDTKDWYAKDNVTYVFTPEQYGAVADGETDDTQAFNDMFNNISDYAVIYLTGKYKLTNNIDVGKAVNIIGNDGVVLYCQRIRFRKNVYCKNVTFDAEDNTNDSMAIVLCEASDSVFDGCSVINNKNGRCGIAFANENSAIQNISVNNCYFENIGSSAIELFFEVTNARITNNTCVDCAINSNLDDGVISTYGDYHRGQIAKDIFISDNIINNSVDSKAFIRLNGVDNAVVKNNICKSTAIAMTASAVLVSDRTNYDIKVYNKNIVISDNIIENNSTAGATIFVRSISTDFNCLISRNKITNNTGKCIGLSNTLEDCHGKITITDNDLKSTGCGVDTAAGSYVKDFDFIFRGNRVDSDNIGIHIVTSGIIDICNNRIVTSGRAISVGDTATSAGGKVNIADNTIIEGNGCIFNSTSEIFVYNNMIKSTVQNAIALYVSDSVAIMNNIISGPANVRILKVSGTYLVDPVNTIIHS